MFLFDLLFGKKAAAEADNAVKADPAPRTSSRMKPATPPIGGPDAAPGTAIRYDSTLIGQFEADHRALLELFGEISKAAKYGQLISVQNLLDQFRGALMDHLLKENVRLYIYLEHVLKGDTVSHELMHSFRREMDSIGRAVVGFLGKYKAIGSRPELAGEFARDLEGIGEALVARIRREEETLYPMYQAPAG